MWNQDVDTQYRFYALNDSFWGLLPSVDSSGSQKWDAVMSFILHGGDTDLDGKVTTADIQTIEANMGKTNAYWDNGDFTDSGVVTPQDLAMAEANLPATPAAATFVAQDTTTQGDWKGVYGSDGYSIVGDLTSLPSDAFMTTSGTNINTQFISTNFNSALQRAKPGATCRDGAFWYGKGPFPVNVSFNDGLEHELSIYAAHIDGEGRAETIQVIDPATGKVLDSRSISSFKNGIWLTWQVRGNVELKFIGTAGPNPIVNGIFFDS